MNKRVRDLIDWGSGISLDYTRNRVSLASGGLAYFVALSLAPAAVAFGALAGLILDPADVRSALTTLAARSPQTVGNVQSVIDTLVGVVEGASGGSFTVTTIVSFVIAVYASSKVVYGVRQAMNTAFGVVEERSGLIERGIAAIATLIVLVAGVAIVVLVTVVPRALSWLGIDDVATSSGNVLIDWGIIALLVFVVVRATIRFAPNGGRRVPWSSLGAAVGTVWIVAVTAGVGIYAHYSTSLGTAVLVFGTAVVILLWLYLCFVGLLLGAVIEAERQRTPVVDAQAP